MDREGDTWMGGRTDRQIDRQANRHMDGWMDREGDSWMGGRTDRQTDRQRQADRQTDRSFVCTRHQFSTCKLLTIVFVQLDHRALKVKRRKGDAKTVTLLFHGLDDKCYDNCSMCYS